MACALAFRHAHAEAVCTSPVSPGVMSFFAGVPLRVRK